MQRRTFLKSAGVATAAGAAFSVLRHPRQAQAAWGDWPADKLEGMIPTERQAKSVLELYMYGGMNAFDTFYTVPKWGMGQQRFLNAFYPETVNRYGQCGFPGELTEGWEGRALDKMGELLGKYRSLRVYLDSCVHCGA